MWSITKVWHIGDVMLGVAATYKKPSLFNIARLAFALSGLAGNVVIERNHLHKDMIEVDGIKWKRVY